MSHHGTGYSGTGVFYQAMPAVGADGRNVMQLIPVQKINGQFVPSLTSLPAAQTVEPQRAVVMNFASAPIVRNMSTTQSSNNGVTKQHFNITDSPNPGQGLGRGLQIDISKQNLLNQRHASLTPSSVPQIVSPVTHAPKSGAPLSLMNTNKMPVTVKSPVLPNGQYLQIPPNAQVKTLPMSALPPGIKKQIFTSEANSPTVLYVSPVTTMNQGSLQPSVATSPSTPQKTPEQTPSVSSSMPSKRSPRTVAKDGSKPVTPIRWIIEEQDGSPAPCLVPVNPFGMASEILKTVAEREKNCKLKEVTAEKPLTPQTQTKACQVRDNALVMCNGKVYFVAKKTPELCKLMAKPLGDMGCLSEKPIGRGRSNRGRSSVPSLLSNPSIESQAADVNKSDSDSIVIPDGPDEIIDLCDDDSQDDSTLQAEATSALNDSAKSQSLTHEDEDSNVIFVSYSPPKPIYRLSVHHINRDPVNKLKAGLKSVRSQDSVSEQNLISTQSAQSNVSVLSEGSCPDVDMTQDVPVSTVNANDKELNTSIDNIAVQTIDTSQGTLSSIELKGSLATDQAGKVLADPSVKETVTSQDVVDIIPEIEENRAVPNDQQEERNEQPAVTSVTDQAVAVLAVPSAQETAPSARLPEFEPLQSTLDPVPEHQTSVPHLESMKTFDSRLKRVFGITSDVKIILKRIGDVQPGIPPKDLPQIGPISKSALEGIRKLIQGSQINFNKRKHDRTQGCLQEISDKCPRNTKMQKTENAPIASPDSAVTKEAQITHIPNACVVSTSEGSEHKKDSVKGQSIQMETTFDANTEEISGIEEPVSSNLFTTTAESEIPALPSVLQVPELSSNTPALVIQTHNTSTSTQGCSLASNNREMKRTRKQRMCSSCPSGAHEHDRKSVSSSSTLCGKAGSSKLSDSAKSTTVEPQNDGKSLKSPCEDVKMASVEPQCHWTTSQPCNASAREISAVDLFSTTSMDPDEITRHEKIRRLKELFKEKEAAVEMLRKNII